MISCKGVWGALVGEGVCLVRGDADVPEDGGAVVEVGDGPQAAGAVDVSRVALGGQGVEDLGAHPAVFEVLREQ